MCPACPTREGPASPLPTRADSTAHTACTSFTFVSRDHFMPPAVGIRPTGVESSFLLGDNGQGLVILSPVPGEEGQYLSPLSILR